MAKMGALLSEALRRHKEVTPAECDQCQGRDVSVQLALEAAVWLCPKHHQEMHDFAATEV